MTDANAAQPAEQFVVNQADLDIVTKVFRAAQEAWLLYAEAQGIADADKHTLVGLDEEGARFDFDVYACGHFMETETVHMPLDYLFDRAALIEQAAAARVERERREAEQREAAWAARRAEAARIANQRRLEAHNTYERIAAEVATGAYVAPSRPE